MPCDSGPLAKSAQQQADMRAALKRLELMLDKGGVGVIIGENGAMYFNGWSSADRKGWSDVCAFRALSAEGSFALQTAVQRAEMMAGRKLDQNMVAAGIHSHDGGHTWHQGH